MSNFSADNSKGDLGGGVQAVYIALESGDIAEIFPTRVSVKTSCRFVGSPSERGLTMFDNKVQNPIIVDLTGIAKAATWDCLEKVKQEIGENIVHRGKFYGKNETVNNMMVESIDEVSTSERFDGIEVHIRLKEFLEEGNTMY